MRDLCTIQTFSGFNIAGTPAQIKLPVLNSASVFVNFLLYESLAKLVLDSKNITKIHSSLAVVHFSAGQAPGPKWDLILIQNTLRVFIQILFFKCTVANLDV